MDLTQTITTLEQLEEAIKKGATFTFEEIPATLKCAVMSKLIKREWSLATGDVITLTPAV